MTFSAYMPTISEVLIGTKYVLNGLNNENYKMFADAYEDSVTNSSCINDICNLIIGEGLINKTKDGLNANSIVSNSDLRLIALDYKIQGQCSYQTVWRSGKPVKIYHIPIRNTALNLDSEMNNNGFWYCYDWSKRYKYTPRLYPKFDGNEPEGGVNMTVIKRPSNEPLFSRPSWYAALKWAQSEGLMAQHSYTDISTGFTGQKIINWAGGMGLTEEEKTKQANRLREDASGIGGKRIIVAITNRPENAVIVDNIDPPNVNATYVNYTEESERKILIAHSYPEILLAGSKTGFSSNADEIEVATNSVFRRVINPDREVLLEEISKVFKSIDPTSEIDFKNFEDEKIEEE